MIAVILAVLATSPDFAATPQQAVLQIVYSANHSHVLVRRTNIVGHYATVLTRGASMEGSAIREAILLEHFSFGWQPLDLLNFRCRLTSHAFTARIEKSLMRNMPMPQDNRQVCGNVGKDAGPPVTVEAIRQQMHGTLVPAVIVSGNYALAQWYGAGAGEALFKEIAARWHLIAGGGGAQGVDSMREHHVPEAAWCAFGIIDAHCPRRP